MESGESGEAGDGGRNELQKDLPRNAEAEFQRQVGTATVQSSAR